MKQETKNIDWLNEIGKYRFGKTEEQGVYLIAREIEQEVNSDINSPDYIVYWNYFEMGGLKYECLEIRNMITESFADSFFNTIAELDMDLISSIKKIESIIKKTYDRVNLMTIRGTFAELVAIRDFNVIIDEDPLSIYDFKTNAGIDLEIKSYSKVKRDFITSYQQLTNSTNALYYLIEVNETEEGISLKELAQELNLNVYDRYGWIFTTNSKLVNKKFISNEYKRVSAEELRVGLSKPEKAKDAHFVYNVDNLNV